MGTHAFLWSTPIRRAITSTTACLGLFAGLGEAIKAAPEVEPFLLSTHYYTRKVADERVAEYKPTINQLLKWQAQDSLSKIDSESAQWNIKLPTEQDPQTRAMIENRLQQLQGEKSRVQQRLDILSK